jgi:HAD superfamily hydrolase (TIGR01509 family)
MGCFMTQYSDITAIVLDIDGTLCSLTHGVGTIYHKLLRAQGLQSDRNALEAAVRHVWGAFQDTYLNVAEEYRTTHQREREVWLEFVQRVCDAANLPYGGDSSVVATIYSAFASRIYRRIEPGAREFLRQASERGLILVAASNNDSRSRMTLHELGLDQYFAHVLVAGDLGWKKPSPHFYTSLAERIGVEPHKILHVGNDRALDVEAARRCGFAAVLYAPQGGAFFPRVGSFAELRTLILG